MRNLLVWLWMAVSMPFTIGTVQAATGLDRAAMQAELKRLADICDGIGLDNQADLCRAWMVAPRADQMPLYLPSEFPQPDGSNPAQASWCQHFSTARRGHAEWLFAEAQRLALAGDEQSAFRMLWQVLREDPQHAEALRVLGPLATATSLQPRMRNSAAQQPDFQWPAKSYSRIQTPHFLLTTRAAARESIQLAKRLEAAHALWSQIFFDQWASPGLLTQRLEGGNQPWGEPRRMQVFLLKDRNDYVETLGSGEDNIAASVGYYNPGAKKSFFYPGPNLEATFIHELTHQLFSESSHLAAVPHPGSQGGVWLLEGIAVYMESLAEHDHYWTLGGIEAPRLQTARYRAVRDGYWPNWQSFAAGSMEAWKADPQVSLYYAQAAGLTHACLDLMPDRELSRDAYLRALAGVYAGRSQAGSEIRDLLGSDDEQAQLAYRRLLTVSADQLAALIDSGFQAHDLVLAGSQLDRQQWQSLSELTQLKWLDLSFSNADNAGLTWLGNLRQLERLSVEGTQVNGQLLPLIAGLKQLNELDLSSCAIDDAALEVLRGHSGIQTLWLTNTPVSDACLEILASLPNLTTCDVAGTRITPAAWQEFEQQRLSAKP